MNNNPINNNQIQSLINQQILKNQSNKNKPDSKSKGKSFENILEKEISFSKHATERLTDRSIEIKAEDMKKIENAFKIAEDKNIKTPLIVSQNLICVADTRSRTIITAMESMKDKVFTNIDGVVNI
jgi:flagellar operon protein